MKLNNASRWALVTFGGCISTGIIGHNFTDGGLSTLAVFAISIFFALIGYFVISE